MSKDNLDKEHVAWSPYHYQDEDGSWCAGVEWRGLDDHSEALRVQQLADTAMQELLDKLDIPEVKHTH